MMRNDAKPMGGAKTKKPSVQVHAKTGKGRPKAPIEKRKKLSDNPHRDRKGPPDIPTGTALNPGAIPDDPPIPLRAFERECWDRIVKSQRAVEAGAWIFRSDCEFVLALCVQYGRLREVRNELNELADAKEPFVDPESGKANPLLAIEKSLSVAYQSGLKELAMVPSRRQVVATDDAPTDDDVQWMM